MLSVPDWREFPYVAFEDRKDLPDSPGLYFVTNSKGQCLYIGMSQKSILRRFNSTHHKFSDIKRHGPATLYYYDDFSDKSVIPKWETLFITKEKPLLNNDRINLPGLAFPKPNPDLHLFGNGVWDMKSQTFVDDSYSVNCLWPFNNRNFWGGSELFDFTPIKRLDGQSYRDFIKSNWSNLDDFSFSFCNDEQTAFRLIALAKAVYCNWLTPEGFFIVLRDCMDPRNDGACRQYLDGLHILGKETISSEKEPTKRTGLRVYNLNYDENISETGNRAIEWVVKGLTCSTASLVINIEDDLLSVAEIKKQIPYLETNGIVVDTRGFDQHYAPFDTEALLNVILLDHNLPKEVVFEWLGIKE